jgi:hypothetical protein
MASRQSAERQQSGEPVRPSGPVLGSAPTPLVTADRRSAACLPYQSQPKTGREFEGGAFIGGEVAVPLSSLDEIQTNRDTVHDPYRLGKCGRLSLRGIAKVSPNSAKFVKVTCKCWSCPHCAPRKAMRYKRAVGELAETHRLNKMLTLTLDPNKLNGEDSARYINRIFANFRIYLKRKLKRSPKFIRVLECHKSGVAHLHILLDSFIQQKWISNVWSRLGGGVIVDIRQIQMRSAASYLGKYLTKEMLLNPPKRSRRVTTSRGLKLNPKIASELSWSLVSVPIGRLHQFYWKQASNLQTDAEGNITGFDLTFPNVTETP